MDGKKSDNEKFGKDILLLGYYTGFWQIFGLALLYYLVV
jgi:hypothetical protein